MNRRRFSRTIDCSFIIALLLQKEVRSEFGFGFGFDIFSWGPFSLEIGVSLPAAILFGSALLLGEVSSFSDSSHTNHYSASYEPPRSNPEPRPEPKKVKLKIETIEIRSSDVVNRNTLRIIYRHNLDENDNILLGESNGYLSLQEDGRMVFKNSPFQGYLYLHNDNKISVFDQRGNPVLIVKPKGKNRVAVLLRRGRNNDDITCLLFGVPIH
jgi:hypothetical protein